MTGIAAVAGWPGGGVVAGVPRSQVTENGASPAGRRRGAGRRRSTRSRENSGVLRVVHEQVA